MQGAIQVLGFTFTFIDYVVIFGIVNYLFIKQLHKKDIKLYIWPCPVIILLIVVLLRTTIINVVVKH